MVVLDGVVNCVCFVWIFVLGELVMVRDGVFYFLFYC